MANSNGSIAVISSSQFKWTAQVQYKESAFTRDEAIRYASEHNCNLIVKYEKRSGPLFDVLQDPDIVCKFESNQQAVETVPVMELPESGSWSKQMFRGVFGLARRLGSKSSNQSAKSS